MRTLLIVSLLLAVAVGGAVLSDAAGPSPSGQDPPAGAIDPTSYAVGHGIGITTRDGLRNDGMGVDMALVTRGFKDGLNGTTPMVSRRDMEAISAAVHAEMEKRRVRRLLADSPDFKEIHDSNLELSRKFHARFGKQPGVVVRPSGAQYLELHAGSGRSPALMDTVVITAQARLLDGTVLDDGKTPFDVEVASTIPGGTEILQLMSEGARWQVALPPDLAYGTSGRYPDVGPNESVVVIVELREIKSGGGDTP